MFHSLASKKSNHQISKPQIWGTRDRHELSRLIGVGLLAAFFVWTGMASAQTPPTQGPGEPLALQPLAGQNLSATNLSANTDIRPILFQMMQRSQAQVVGGLAVETSLIRPLYVATRALPDRPLFVIRNTLGLYQLTNEGNLVLAALQSAPLRGLQTEDYWNARLADIQKLATTGEMPAQEALEMELSLAQGLVRLASHAAHGRVDPKLVDDETDLTRRPFREYEILAAGLSRGQLQATLDELEPKHLAYRRLRDLLKSLRETPAERFRPIDARETLRPGVTHRVVPQIRQRLADLGYGGANPSDLTSAVYDPALVAIVQDFQTRHKLEPDGVIGPRAFAAFNTTLAQRIQQVRVNMERWRWMPTQLANRHVFVNTAHQELAAVEGDREVLRMKTVIGRVLRRTPTLVDRFTDIRLNPYWSAPASIAAKDLVPKFATNLRGAQEIGIRVFDLRGQEVDPTRINWRQFSIQHLPFYFRQDPGPHNSLGQVKFNLTNSRAIYLHDTPHREDFPKSVRQFSSGCIRLEDPLRFALYLLRDQPEWTAERIQDFWSRPLESPDFKIDLREQVSVYIGFFTVEVPTEGGLTRVKFAPDSYGQDGRILQLMQPLNVNAGGQSEF
jgi:murein L,D-transpeptidase YcbB/YkuD